MIAYYYDGSGKVTLLDLTPLQGHPDQFIAFKKSENEPPASQVFPRSRRRKRAARPETIEQAKKIGAWLRENPGTYPLYNIIQKVLGIKSAGTAANISKEAAKQRLAKIEIKKNPHTISSP